MRGRVRERSYCPSVWHCLRNWYGKPGGRSLGGARKAMLGAFRWTINDGFGIESLDWRAQRPLERRECAASETLRIVVSVVLILGSS